LPHKHFQLLTLGQISLRADAGEDADLAKRRRKIALLAVLALSRRPPSRASLAEMFWGNLDEDRARHSLSDALSHLRRVLGRDSIAIRSEVVELDMGGKLVVDAIEFEAAYEARDYARATHLYGGPFLADFHVERSMSFDDWVTRARDRYARMFIGASEAHCAELLRAGQFAECVAPATAWIESDVVSANAASTLLQAAQGTANPDIARQALADYERWSARRTRDIGVDPDQRLDLMAKQILQSLANRTLARPPISVAEPVVEPTAADVVVELPAPFVSSDTPNLTDSAVQPTDVQRWSRSRWMLGTAACAIAAAVLGLVTNHRAAAREGPLMPVVALVDFSTDKSDSSLAWLGEGLKQMIAADLSRVAMSEVIPVSVVRDAANRAGVRDSSTAEQRIELARSVHATMAVSANVSRNNGAYVVTVTLQGVESASGTRRYTATGNNVLLVADQIAAHVLSVSGIETTGPRLSDVETSNTEAYRHFVQGEHDVDEGRTAEANKQFDLAIAADSNFTSAIVAKLHSGYVEYIQTKPLYDRVQARLTEWDRMSERVRATFHDGEHGEAEVLGRELEARFPRDPRAIAMLANIYFHHARFPDAERAYLRLLALDSLALMAGHGPCAPCGALEGLAEVRRAMGDTAGARNAVLRWTELQPGSPAAWANYGNGLSLVGATEQGIVALRRAHVLLADSSFDAFSARTLVSARRYQDADAMARSFLNTTSDGDARDIVSLVERERGQFRAAGALLEKSGGLEPIAAQSLAAIGDTAAAQRIFKRRFFNPSAISRGGALVGAVRGDEARSFSWEHALEADALWEHADTIFLHAIADSVETIGIRSYYARDWQLHHHIRGLIALRAGRLDDAEREFTAGMSLFPGWTRTNLMLARTLLAQRHPDRAIETLRRAYIEPLDAMGRYVPRSELDFEMARAFVALDRADSARVYSDYVRRAWANADPEIKARLKSLPL
jgi:DNA-binding SARP family transcriptional activator/predicted Zn-dependent protease